MCSLERHRPRGQVSLSLSLSFFGVHTKSTLAEQTTPMTLAPADVSKSVSAASFGDLDLVASAGALAVAWTPPENDAGVETYVTYLAAGATGAAGSGGALAGRRAVGTKVFTVSSDTGSAGKSHFMVHPKFMLAELTAPVALAPTDVSKSVSAVSFGDLD